MPPEAPTISQPSVTAPRAAGLSRAPQQVRHQKQGWAPLRRLYWLVSAALLITVGLKAPGQSPESVFGALLILVAAMVPSYMWVSGRVRGLPLFPACALTCIWTFALPLVSEHPLVMQFPGWNQLVAALSIVLYLVLGTVSWSAVARRPPQPPRVCWMMNEAQSGPVLLVALGISAIYTMVATADWIHLTPGVLAFARAISLAIQALSCFVLSYRLGSNKLAGPVKVVFIVTLSFLIVAILPSLLLIYAMSVLAISLMAYVVASKRLPWRVGLAALFAFGFLHLGKAKMRDKHWGEQDIRAVDPFEYPAFIREWIDSSLEAIREGKAGDDTGGSLLERASLMHWLLFFQANTPGAVPFLNGETYALIPRMLVPRILDANKPRSNEASYVLAIHYGVMTREDTEVTTFAFGLINEAYVNFGFIGVGVLGVVLGTFYGKASQWARRTPILSFRALFAVVVASYSFQAEYVSTFLAAALFQSTVVLIVMTLLFMRPGVVNPAQVSLLD